MHLQKLTRAELPHSVSRPDPGKVIAGDPVHTDWTLEEAPGLYTGFWHSTPGSWRVAYDEWEYIHILEGHSVLIAEDGSETHLRPGESLVIRPGFRGIWQVIAPTLKEFVIRL